MVAERVILYRLRVAQDEANSKALQAFERANLDVQKRIEKAEKQAAEQSLRRTEKKAKEDEAQHRRIFQNRVRLLDRIAKEERARREASLRQERENAKKTLAAWEKAQGEIRAGRDQMREGLLTATESVAKLGRGFAALGLVGEESTEALLRGLVKIQGTFDVVVGGIETYFKLTKAVQGFAAASQAAAQAEQLGRTRNIALIEAEIAATTQLTAARTASSVASGVAGGTGAVGGAAGAAGGFGGTLFEGSVEGVAGAGAAGAATRGRGLLSGLAGMVKAGAKRLAPLGLAALKVGAAATVGAEALQKTRRSLGDTSDNAESLIGALVDWRTEASKAAESTERLTKAEENANRQAAMRQRQAEKEQLDFEARRSLFESRDRLLAGQITSTPQEELGLIRRRRQLAAAARRTMPGADTDLGAAQRRDNMVDLLEKEKSLLQQQLTIEQQIKDTKLAGVREAIQGAKTELDIVRQKIKANEQSLLSAKERFGQLDPLQQSQLIGIKRKADRFGFESLTREERQRLRSVGTEGATGIAQRGDVAAADRAGFDRFFGSEEREEIREGRRRERDLKLEIQDKRRLEIQIEENEQRIVQQFGDLVEQKIREREALFRNELQEELDRRVNDLAGSTQSDLLQRSRAAAIRGR